MKTLLRSTFVVKDEPVGVLIENFRMLEGSKLGFEDVNDNSLWGFIRDFVHAHHHPPDVSTIRSHFERSNLTPVVDRLEEITITRPKLTSGDFEAYINGYAEQRKKALVARFLQEASDILTKGVEVKEKGAEKTILIGPNQAMQFLLDKAHDILTPITGVRLSGEVTQDGDDFIADYNRVKLDPLAGVGQFTGLTQMDDVLGGAKRYELWTHAAFTGGMKTSTMLNWAYNQAVHYTSDVLIFSLEMPYHQCRRLLYVLHSRHPKFAKVHAPLDYERTKVSKNTPEEEVFMLSVAEDFKSGGYGKIFIEVADPNKTDFTMADIRHRAETLYAKTPFRLLFIDHALLVSPRKWVPNPTDRTNEVIRDAKKLAMSFNKGLGMAVVILFQISREGYKAALKARGGSGGEGRGKGGGVTVQSNYVYNLTHLSYANECLVGSTLIPTLEGFKPLTSIQVGDEVWSRTGWKRVLATFDQGVRPTWEVVTDRGSRLEVTAEHRVRVLRDETVDWASVSELRGGDWVMGARGVSEWPTQPSTLPIHEGLGTPSTLSVEGAYVLGAWHGDGHEKQYGVSFTGNRKEAAVESRIHAKFSTAFGRDMTPYHFKSRPGSFDMEHYGKAFRDWFHEVAGEHHGTCVPDVIHRSPREHVLAFLKGLFDTDGWINNQNVMGLKMKSRSFLEGVQHLLTRLGLDSRLERTDTYLKVTDTTYEGWTLRIRGHASMMQFNKEIGFTEPHKAARLHKHVTKGESTVKDKDVYPVGTVFLALCREHTPYGLISSGRLTKFHYNNQYKAKKTGLASRGAIQYLLDYLTSEGISDTRADFLREVLALHVMQVASVGPTGRSEPVYDIEVGGDHEYASGPLLSHNCERSSDVVTASWLDEELAKNNQVLYQCLKSRDTRPFEPFLAGVQWGTRAVFTLIDANLEDARKAGDEIDISRETG